MARLLLRRVLSLLPLLFIVSVLFFGLLVRLPGDPAHAIAGDQATPSQVAAVRTSLGLDRPLVVQYGHWVGGILRGDLGKSVIGDYPVRSAIASRAPVTISLVGA